MPRKLSKSIDVQLSFIFVFLFTSHNISLNYFFNVSNLILIYIFNTFDTLLLSHHYFVLSNLFFSFAGYINCIIDLEIGLIVT